MKFSGGVKKLVLQGDRDPLTVTGPGQRSRLVSLHRR